MNIVFKNGEVFEVDLVLAKLECTWIVTKNRLVFLVNKMNIDETVTKA